MKKNINDRAIKIAKKVKELKPLHTDLSDNQIVQLAISELVAEGKINE